MQTHLLTCTHACSLIPRTPALETNRVLAPPWKRDMFSFLPKHMMSTHAHTYTCAHTFTCTRPCTHTHMHSQKMLSLLALQVKAQLPDPLHKCCLSCQIEWAKENLYSLLRGFCSPGTSPQGNHCPLKESSSQSWLSCLGWKK